MINIPQTRLDVFEIINGEREYQIKMTNNPDRPDMIPDLHAGDYILAMEHCLAEARKIWYSDSDPYQNTMELIRKIAGLSVSCMEKYGAPKRDQ